ncbi:MAG: 5-methyltetrahydropteroyltriglutamate--homocysteine S-methyltransferase [Lachnospiraceae bacterium]|nr:5-methyltetrahydropteroyltriglutamate--homocysteine S-methyltransferase [Lachnospiraceae bacterium]
MNNTIVGFPRVGKLRELKFISEKYFRGEVNKEELLQVAKELRAEHWKFQKNAGVGMIPSNDFSFYDGVLDAAVLFNVIPKKYKDLQLDDIDTYFAMARGYQGKAGDVKALAMKKWFNTNYHYLVPEIDDDTEIKLVGEKPFQEYHEASQLGIQTKPVIVGPFTFLKLAKYQGRKLAADFADELADAYIAMIRKIEGLGAEWIQFDEPSLVTDLIDDDLKLFAGLYEKILPAKGGTKILLQTYFGDIRDCYKEIVELDFDGIGLDFVEGKESFSLVEKYGFPKDKVLFAGLVNGKNIWKSNYEKILSSLEVLKRHTDEMVLSTTCSLLHVPYTLENESSLKPEISQFFAFALEKLQELNEISILTETDDFRVEKEYLENKELFEKERLYQSEDVKKQVNELKENDFVRLPVRSERAIIQKSKLKLPLFPTTTIGSFPQTIEVKKNRTQFKKGEIDKATYDAKVNEFISDCIREQENMGIDVLVHGEYERNDMVEFFGENLEGYVFTEKAWVQSYGTRCVKPPIIFGDVKRTKPITTEYLKYAQSLTDKPVKGMLTGPVTILNWSFPREDISLKEMAFQIGIAIREEVNDLENAGIKIIQIDEAALKEKLPIRKSDWYKEYLDWAIPAFRLCHSNVKSETQIHTHMCYSEFDEIIKDIDNMDADVISFEASRSKLTILEAIKENNFETEVGPGVYDIHSPRVPSVDEIVKALEKMLGKIDKNKLWINPDCGLKTRGITETKESLKNLVAAANILREQY